MKQISGGQFVIVTTITIQLFSILCQVQCGIITNQQSSALPAEIANAQAVAPSSTGSDSKNSSRTGRVMYTAPYSNVRISSKEPKSLKPYFPVSYVPKKPSAIAARVPVLDKVSTTTSTTTTTVPTSSTSPAAQAVRQTLPDIMEILEEMQAESGEVVTEAASSGETGVTEDNENL